MNTVSVNCKVIKGSRKHEFNIVNSYTFRNCSMIIATLIDGDELIDSTKNVKYCEYDDFISFNIFDAVEDILHGKMENVYKQMYDSTIFKNEFGAVGIMLNIIIDYNKQIYSNNNGTHSFTKIKQYIIKDLFNG